MTETKVTNTVPLGFRISNTGRFAHLDNTHWQDAKAFAEWGAKQCAAQLAKQLAKRQLLTRPSGPAVFIDTSMSLVPPNKTRSRDLIFVDMGPPSGLLQKLKSVFRGNKKENSRANKQRD